MNGPLECDVLFAMPHDDANVGQVRFIDAESATVAEEVFDHLQSAKLAIDAIHAMMSTNYRSHNLWSLIINLSKGSPINDVTPLCVNGQAL